MIKREPAHFSSRRDFLKGLAAAGAALTFGAPLGSADRQVLKTPPDLKRSDFEYQYRAVSVEHLYEMKDWLARLDRDRKLSRNEIFRKYIAQFEFEAPQALPDAQSLIILSIPIRISTVTFHLNGQAHDVLIPGGYVDYGVSVNDLKKRISADILKDSAARLEPALKIPIKTLAVRSGLAKYGINNVSYVEGYGSYHDPNAFYTDMPLPDHWGPLRMLRLCKGCSICLNACPTKAITTSNFVIDAGKCLSLYNERREPMPDWIDPKAHHALVGCLRCQFDCPANDEGNKRIEKLADISEEETRLLLDASPDQAVRMSIAKKLSRFPSAGHFDHFSRNFKLAWANISKS